MEEGKGAKGLKTKLIVNYLPQTMTDGEFNSLFSAIGPLESYKIMRDKNTNYSFGYGFVDYTNELDAETAIGKLNGYRVVNKTLRVAYSKPPGASKNVNLYISGLTTNTDETNLEELFSPYGELVYTRILRNADGSSKSVGFVLFKDKNNADAAIRDLQGHAEQGMKLHIKYAKDSSDQENPHPKFQEYLQHKFMQQSHPMYNQGMGMSGMGYQQFPSQQMGYQDPYGGGYGAQVGYGINGDGGQKAMRGRDVSARFNPISRPLGGAGVSGGMGMGMSGVGGSMDDSNASALFCYLGHDASDAELYALFSKFGRITKVDVVAGKGYGFVHMPIPMEANEALMSLNGSFYNGKVLQVSIKKLKT